MDVVCTAGHVDHGKSALVRALTGMEPDRFDEERRRGLTIDIGFAWARLGSPPRTVAFVDLPGHERFVANMLAGAGPVETALFVVAADEGWMPQSQEHLDILDLLGVRRGVVALTKADTVDGDTLEIARELTREALGCSVLASADVLAVSARTGAGLAQLVQRLTDLLAAAPAAADRGRPRLWVDRSFTVHGAGTVVTGTLAGGRLRTGHELAVLPPGRGRGPVTGRVRGLQTLQSPVEEASPGSRVAVNLSGVDRADVTRGHSLGLPDQWLAVEAFDASLRALPGQRISRRGAWHLHAGSGQRLARVLPLAGRAVTGEGFVRVELEQAMALTAGDRVVLREAGRRATVGGGVVLDPAPPAAPRGTAARRERAAQLGARAGALAAGDLAVLLALHVAERGAADSAEAAAAVGLAAGQARAAARSGRLLTLGGMWADPEAAKQWASAVSSALAAHHAAHPVERAARKDVAARAAEAAGCPPGVVDDLLAVLVRLGRIVAEGPGLRAPEHSVRLSPAETAARAALLEALRAAPFTPPRLAQAAAGAGASEALVRELEASGELVRLAPDLALAGSAVDEAVDRLRVAYRREGPLTAARAKEVLGTSRKYALPLLEELDRRGRTRRLGDVREVL